MIRSFKYRIYPNKSQVRIFEMILKLCRELYNAALYERKDAYEKFKISLNYYSQSEQLPEIKKDRQEFKDIYAQILQNVLSRVQKAFDGFFRRVKFGDIPGYPIFKKYNRYNSFTYPSAKTYGFRIIKNKIRLGKIGDVKIKLHRELPGTPKTCTIKRDSDNKWYVFIVCDNVAPKVYQFTNKEIGIDLGLNSYLTDSNGNKVDNERHYRKTEKRLKIKQRELAKKQEKSNRRKKCKLQLSKLHKKIYNQREDFQHKLSTKIVTENQLIAVEDLKPQEMIKESKNIKQVKGMNKSILDASWGKFLQYLSYKAEEAGRKLVKVDPKGTTSTCYICEATV